MSAVQRFNFHTMRGLKAKTSIAYRLTTFAPEGDVKIVGATLGLLTNGIADHTKGCVELYVAVTYNNTRPSSARNWVQLKRDFLFYSQRDVYVEPTSPNDLVVNNWLPSGHYFEAGPQLPVNIYAGALNTLPWDTVYDVFGCIYYVRD